MPNVFLLQKASFVNIFSTAMSFPSDLNHFLVGRLLLLFLGRCHIIPVKHLQHSVVIRGHRKILSGKGLILYRFLPAVPYFTILEVRLIVGKIKEILLPFSLPSLFLLLEPICPAKKTERAEESIFLKWQEPPQRALPNGEYF